MGPENKREDDDSDNEQQTEILKKPDIKGVMDTISIIEIYSHFSKFCAGMRKLIGEASRLIYLDKLSKKAMQIEHYFSS